MPRPWFDSLRGITYAPGGETKDGADCYGLVRLAYREILRREAPTRPTGDFDGDAPRGWQQVSQARTGDVVVFRFHGLPCHCGVVAGRNLMLHAIQGKTSCIERFDSPMWERRVAGFFRLQEAQ